MWIVPVMALITAGAVALALIVKNKSFAAGVADTVDLTHHIKLKLAKGVPHPVGIDRAAWAIDEVLALLYGAWWEKMTLVIDWRPFGDVIVGPFIKTGFEDRASGRAVAAPVPPYAEGLEKTVARVVGTIRIEKHWWWSKQIRMVVIIMDGRVGATHREVLLGQDSGKPQAPVEKSALFYEVAWRAAPMGIDGLKAVEIPSYDAQTSNAKKYRDLEAAFGEAYKGPTPAA